MRAPLYPALRTSPEKVCQVHSFQTQVRSPLQETVNRKRPQRTVGIHATRNRIPTCESEDMYCYKRSHKRVVFSHLLSGSWAPYPTLVNPSELLVCHILYFIIENLSVSLLSYLCPPTETHTSPQPPSLLPPTPLAPPALAATTVRPPQE